jgi:hypothetical protein
MTCCALNGKNLVAHAVKFPVVDPKTGLLKLIKLFFVVHAVHISEGNARTNTLT